MSPGPYLLKGKDLFENVLSFFFKGMSGFLLSFSRFFSQAEVFCLGGE